MKSISKLVLSKHSIMAFLAYILMFVNFPYLPYYNYIRYAIIVILGIYVIRRFKIFFIKKYMPINCSSIIFGLLTITTSFINQNRMTDRNPFLAAIVFMASFLLFLFFMEITAEKGMIKSTIKLFCAAAFILVIITDFIMFAFPSLVISYKGNYFIGSKFSVVYLHLFLLILSLTNLNLSGTQKFRKKGLILYLIWVLIISTYVDCATGIVGAVIYLLLVYAIEKKEIFFNEIFYAGALLLSFAFVYFYEFVLGNQFVQKIIVDVLGRDITLTSRTRIYETTMILLSKHNAWGIGFGYGSSYELGMKYGNFPDTQNGLLEWIWQTGVPTTVVLVLVFVSILLVAKNHINNSNKKALIPLLAGLYLFIILATIEITYSLLFIGIACCMVCISTEKAVDKI